MTLHIKWLQVGLPYCYISSITSGTQILDVSCILGPAYQEEKVFCSQHLPEGPPLWIIEVITLHRVIARVPGTALQQQLLWQSHGHWELVQRSVGLGGGMVRRRDAVAGLTAVVTISVIHRTVRIFKSCGISTVNQSTPALFSSLEFFSASNIGSQKPKP